MKNQVIEVLNGEHGAKVLKYWQDKGVKTTGYFANQTKDAKDSCRYYGVIDGYFSNYDIMRVNGRCAEIIHLPEEKMVHKRNKLNKRITKRTTLITIEDKVINPYVHSITFDESCEIAHTCSFKLTEDMNEFKKEKGMTLNEMLKISLKIKKIFGLGNGDELIIKM